MTRTADAVVIGAGVIGSGVALELARSGRSVVIVDKGAGPGLGSTSASSTIVRFNYSTWEGAATSWEAKFGWENWADHLGHIDPAGMARYVRTGGLVFDSPNVAFDRVVAHFARVGIPYELLDAAALRAKFPYVDNGRFYPPKRVDDDEFWADADGELGGLFTPEGGFVDDATLAAHNLHHAATAEGATTLFHAEVVAVPRSGDQVTGVELADGTNIGAPVVVNVAGPHSAQVNQIANVQGDFTITTRALRQEVQVVPAPAGYSVTAPSPFVADGDLGIYFRPLAGGDLLVGGLEPECDPLEWIDDADDVDWNPSRAAFDNQVTRLARRLPDVTVPNRPRAIVGLYDVTQDWIPIYDRTSLDGYYVAIGTSGNQFKNAPVVGQMMRALIDASEAGHDHDATPLSWSGPRTGLLVDLRHFSRKREITAESTFSVLG